MSFDLWLSNTIFDVQKKLQFFILDKHTLLLFNLDFIYLEKNKHDTQYLINQIFSWILNLQINKNDYYIKYIYNSVIFNNDIVLSFNKIYSLIDILYSDLDLEFKKMADELFTDFEKDNIF